MIWLAAVVVGMISGDRRQGSATNTIMIMLTIMLFDANGLLNDFLPCEQDQMKNVEQRDQSPSEELGSRMRRERHVKSYDWWDDLFAISTTGFNFQRVWRRNLSVVRAIGLNSGQR